MNKIIKLLLVIILIFFLSLYFTNYSNNYYEDKTILTEEAIRNYEKDLKDGKNITSKNYLPDEKNYNNNASKIGLNISNFIEKIVDKGFKFLTKYLENTD